MLFAAIVFATFQSFAVPPVTAPFYDKELARMIFFHLPCAIVCPIFLIAGAIFSIRYLRSENLEFDVKAQAAIEVANGLALLTLATGILFSRVQWLGWWDWDPRQASFLLVEMILVAYFLLRANIRDRVKRAKSAASYALAASLPLFFLIFAFPRLPQIAKLSSHPSNTVMQGDLKGVYGSLTLALIILIGLAWLWAFRYAVRAGNLLLQAENYGHLETHLDGSTPTGVVRPVRLSSKD